MEKLWHEIIRRNYHRKLWASILCLGKCGNYRDTGVSKKQFNISSSKEKESLPGCDYEEVHEVPGVAHVAALVKHEP